MQRIDDHFTEPIFDPFDYMGPKRKKLLETGWPGLFRNYLFEKLPLHEIRKHFHETMGRPTKECYAIVGTLILQQMFDYTDAQTMEAFAFRSDWHYALDIRDESDRSMYVCERTLREYRRIAVESELDVILFGSLTDELLKAFQIPTGKQRLDSTHLQSNMRRLSRLTLFVNTIEDFLQEMRRKHPRILSSQVEPEIVARYLDPKNGCFAWVKGDEVKKSLQMVAEDLLLLVRTFETHKQVKTLKSFALLQRVLNEQCVVQGEAQDEKVELKPAKDVGGTCLQNPSDPDATYDGHKGQGYQVQIAETYQEWDKPDPCLPNFITHANVETAACSDSEAVLPAIKELKERGCAPEELVADTAYGSDDNVQDAAEESVELIAPTKGEPKRKDSMLVLDDFEVEEETGEVTQCPANESPVQIVPGKDGQLKVNFDPEQCAACEYQDYCCVGMDKNHKIEYTQKNLRLAKRRKAEESEEFREKYRWRSGIEAANAQLKRVCKIGRLRVRGFGRVRFAVMVKLLSWNIRQATRARKARIRAFLRYRSLWEILAFSNFAGSTMSSVRQPPYSPTEPQNI